MLTSLDAAKTAARKFFASTPMATGATFIVTVGSVTFEVFAKRDEPGILYFADDARRRGEID